VQSIAVPLGENSCVKVLNQVNEMKTILIARANMHVRHDRKKSRMCLPHGASHKTLKQTQKRPRRCRNQQTNIMVLALEAQRVWTGCLSSRHVRKQRQLPRTDWSNLAVSKPGLMSMLLNHVKMKWANGFIGDRCSLWQVGEPGVPSKLGDM
jgi:hypothetical protein